MLVYSVHVLFLLYSSCPCASCFLPVVFPSGSFRNGNFLFDLGHVTLRLLVEETSFSVFGPGVLVIREKIKFMQ